jgi:hypothetical protein
MIIDLHTHVWSSADQLGPEMAGRLRARQTERWATYDASPAAHEQAMTCVTGSLVMGFRADRLGARIPNEYIAEFVGRNPRRRIGVAGIDPMAEDALDQVDAAVGLGLLGVTVSPACQGFHPAHSDAMRVYERCHELGLPLFVSAEEPLTSAAVLEFARPAHWDEVARAFPALPVVIARIGHPWIDETLILLEKHNNVYADVSGVASRPWQLFNALLNAASFGVMHKLMFGSGFPHDSPARTIESLYTINAHSHATQLPSIPRSQIRSIVERDSLQCLGIESEMTAEAPAPSVVTAPASPHGLRPLGTRAERPV